MVDGTVELDSSGRLMHAPSRRITSAEMQDTPTEATATRRANRRVHRHLFAERVDGLPVKLCRVEHLLLQN
jgi:hypothetical protein